MHNPSLAIYVYAHTFFSDSVTLPWIGWCHLYDWGDIEKSMKWVNISMIINVYLKLCLRIKDQYAGVNYTFTPREMTFFFRKCRKFVILTGTHFVTQNWQYLANSCRYTQNYKHTYFKHMELLVGAIFIILVERWQLWDFLFNPFPKLSQSIAIRYKQFYPCHPKHTKKQHISIKTDALSHNKEWKINIWGKIYIFTSCEMM